jgi:hypothetical protein
VSVRFADAISEYGLGYVLEMGWILPLFSILYVMIKAGKMKKNGPKHLRSTVQRQKRNNNRHIKMKSTYRVRTVSNQKKEGNPLLLEPQ